jgi:hypothetical protein
VGSLDESRDVAHDEEAREVLVLHDPDLGVRVVKG